MKPAVPKSTGLVAPASLAATRLAATRLVATGLVATGLVATGLTALCCTGPAVAQDGAAAVTPAVAATGNGQPTSLGLELNKLEPLDKGCRAYMVIDNKWPADYEAFKIDLYMFRPDGVIGRRFAIDLAPLKGAKRTVKLFDLGGAACSDVGSFLVNDVLDCRSAGAAVGDCLTRLVPSSLAPAKLSK